MTGSRTLWPKVPAAFVEKNLTGHKILGLVAAAVLYLICLSGTATVFYTDMQDWETPGLPAVTALKPEGVAAAITDARAHIARADAGSPIYVYTPTSDFHRLTVQAGKTVRGYDGDGRFAGIASHPVTDAITELHYDLHLPSTLGFIVVGLGGVVILALVIGGFTAHPRLLKDAFLWRLNGTPRVNRADLHNRIGVWASPFHIVIALSGALIGLSQVLTLVAAIGFYHGDTTAASAPLFGPSAVASGQGQVTPAAIVAALATIHRDVPDATPNFIGINAPGSGHETLDVNALIKDRLVYGDEFHFTADGRLEAAVLLSKGPAGQQIFASLYKLHFGSFGGVWVQWAYLVLGAGLTLICTTGVDIWLLKSAQKGRPWPRLHRVWTAFVWAAPTALAIAALVTLTAHFPYVPVFWLTIAALTLAGLAGRTYTKVSKIGRCTLAASLLALVAAHALRFGMLAFTAGLGVNLSLLALAMALLVLVARPPAAKTASPN